MRASDIHIEPAADRLAIRYRIDGVMREFERRADDGTEAIRLPANSRDRFDLLLVLKQSPP
jgi:hypothetical protein